MRQYQKQYLFENDPQWTLQGDRDEAASVTTGRCLLWHKQALVFGRSHGAHRYSGKCAQSVFLGIHAELLGISDHFPLFSLDKLSLGHRR
mmetsp:Transcript_12665/g.32009  ORF Transcript_12665/g.32009 Transcript_12665/m.32009 type:complete len:90 (+) Transcript_12665:968-1237(+)